MEACAYSDISGCQIFQFLHSRSLSRTPGLWSHWFDWSDWSLVLLLGPADSQQTGSKREEPAQVNRK